MDYSTVLEALQAHALENKAAFERWKEAHPRGGRGKGSGGMRTYNFHNSLAKQLEKWLATPNDERRFLIPFSPKQIFYVAKAFPYELWTPIAFWDFYNTDKRQKGVWDTHDPNCPVIRGGESGGLDIDIDTDVVRCRDCGAELGQIVPLVDIDPVYAATSECVEVGDTLDLDSDCDLFEEVA